MRGPRSALPLLRKDFIVDEYQIVEAGAAGADAVLLIVAALDDATLAGLLRAARDAGLAALVEVHDAAELDRAVDAGAEIIGVNNRNLRTLTSRVDTSESLVDRIPDGCVAVAESGLRSRPTTCGRLAAGWLRCVPDRRAARDGRRPRRGARCAPFRGE